MRNDAAVGGTESREWIGEQGMKSTDGLVATATAFVAALAADDRFLEVRSGLVKWGVDIASETSKEQDALLIHCIKKFVGSNDNY